MSGYDLRVRALRAWYFLRECLGFPRRLTAEEFDKASPTILLAGSPWVWTAATAHTITFASSNTAWSMRNDHG